MGTKAERRAARERVSACHQAQLDELLSHVGAAIDRYRADEIDAYAGTRRSTSTIVPPQNSGGSASPRGGGALAEFIAGLLDRMTAGAESIDWWERATPRRRQ